MPTDFVTAAFVNGGRWVARCPRPLCTNAEQAGRCDDGSIGGLTGDRFTCRTEYGGCGLVCEAVWPANVDEITTVLAARPVPASRNWELGESVVALIAENLQHGCDVPQLVVDHVVAAAGRREIGA